MFLAKVVRCNSMMKAVRVSVQNMELDKLLNVVRVSLYVIHYNSVTFKNKFNVTKVGVAITFVCICNARQMNIGMHGQERKCSVCPHQISSKI